MNFGGCAGVPTCARSRGNPLQKGSESSERIADALLEIVNLVTPGMTLKYNKHYVGLARNGIADNYAIFFPKHERLNASFRIARSEDVNSMIDSSGLDRLEHDMRGGRYRVRLTMPDVEKNRDLFLELTRRASGTPTQY